MHKFSVRAGDKVFKFTMSISYDKDEEGWVFGHLSNKPLKYLGATYVTIYYNNSDAHYTYMGKAHCSTQDTFNKQAGAREALRNLVEKLRSHNLNKKLYSAARKCIYDSF